MVKKALTLFLWLYCWISNDFKDFKCLVASELHFLSSFILFIYLLEIAGIVYLKVSATDFTILNSTRKNLIVIKTRINILIHYMPLISFYSHWKHQKIRAFLMFSGGIERDHGMKWVNWLLQVKRKRFLVSWALLWCFSLQYTSPFIFWPN